MADNDNTSLDQSTLKRTKLLIFDKAKKIKYFGKCKMSMTPADKCFTLVLDDEESTEITSTFNRRFFVIGNFLCVSDILTMKDFIIIFSQKALCDLIFEKIDKLKPETFYPMSPEFQDNLFKGSFFIPIVQEIRRSVAGHAEIKETLLEMINALDGDKKELYLNLIVETLLASVVGMEDIKDVGRIKPLNANECTKVSDDVRIKGEAIETTQNGLSLVDETLIDSDLEDDVNSIPAIEKNIHESQANKNYQGNGCCSDSDNNENNILDDGERESQTQERRKSLRKRSMNVSYKDNNNDSDDESYCGSGNESASDDEMPRTKKRRSIISTKQKQHVKNEKNPTPLVSNLDSTNFEIVEYTEKKQIKKRLLVFTSKDRKKCYRYSYSGYHHHYYCIKCDPRKHYVFATVLVDDTGSKELEFGKNEHRCAPVDYLPENYTSTKIIKLPGYEVIERPSKKRMVKRLIIFEDDNKKLCYEYSLDEKGFKCMACTLLHKYVAAKLITDSENGDYVELSRAEHVCKPKKWTPIDTTIQTIHKPYFKILTVENGNGRKTLKIFDPTDMTLFYSYYYSNTFKCFICSGCSKKQPHRQVSAKLCHDENGFGYIELSKLNHICSMKKSQFC